MKTRQEKLEDNKVKIEVTIESSDIDKRISKTYKDFAYKYSFPGFRKGKAPRPVIDSVLGVEAVCASVTDDVVKDTYPLVYDIEDIYPLGDPEFDEIDICKSGEDFTYSFTVSVYPDYELTDYDPVKIEMPDEGASESEIDEQIEDIRSHYYKYEDAKDFAQIDSDSHACLNIAATDQDGKNVDILMLDEFVYGLGENFLPKSFDDEILGLKKNDKKEFSIDLKDETSTYTSSLDSSTKTLNFEVEVVSVKEKIVPPLTDEWVKETFDFDSVDDLREKVKESIISQKEDVFPRLKESLCMEQIIKRMESEPTDGMVDEKESELLQDFFKQLQQQGQTFDAYLKQQDITSEQFKEDIKQQATIICKEDMSLDAWSKHFNFEVTDDDIKAEFEKSGSKDPQALEKQWREAGNLFLIKKGILRVKAVRDIMDRAIVSKINNEKTDKDTNETPSKKSDEETVE